MARVNIKSNADFIARHMKKRLAKMEKGLGNSVKTTAQFGKELMFRLAPFDTGATARAIQWTAGNTGKHATIVIGEGHPDRVGKIQTPKGKGGLTKFMNYGTWKTDYWTSGEPRFIEVSKAEIKKRFSRKVRTVVNAFVR